MVRSLVRFGRVARSCSDANEENGMAHVPTRVQATSLLTFSGAG